MKQLITWLIISVLLQACAENQTTQTKRRTTIGNSEVVEDKSLPDIQQKTTLLMKMVNDIDEMTASRIEMIDNIKIKIIKDLFLEQFQEATLQNLHIYTPPENYENQADTYSGRQIDTSFYKLLVLDSDRKETTIDPDFYVFACYKFRLTAHTTGLIIRQRSQYSETAIDLYTWDNKAQKVTNIINLADAFGDEGWSFAQDAWIEDVNGDQQLDIVIRKKERDQNLDKLSAISYSDTTVVYLGDGNIFKKNNFKIDHNKYQLKHWKTK